MLDSVTPVASLGLADSINPVTILVAVYLASTREPRRRLASFVIGVFAVYLLGGLALVLGPAELLHSALTRMDIPREHVASLAAGGIAIIMAAWLWARRAGWGQPRLPERALQPGSALALGAVVTAIDLPTAFPYFGAIGVIVSSDASLIGQLLLLVMFNAVYVLPLALVLGVHLTLGARSKSTLARAREAVQWLAAPLLATVTLVGGSVLLAHGASGLIG